ncbi:thioredoxin H-type-like protein [Cinnamomum micranthum f. kanehirae]|uniref:Thioredoxin H-type-like protein n=1 Tax=Cinnamomum micranthum f. kanehirae TaxID=337451 RepID=A0A443NGJ2_9MAGN|nr:thioredoxin H-type-like protein [Cinnamomum micranthum f. kanehirae]
MGAQISTNLSSGCPLREQRYLNIKSKADLGRYIKDANKSTLMVINFTTTWCQPCIDAEPPMRKLAEEFQEVKFARVDIDLLQDVVKEFDLKTMPTFLLCKKVDGQGAAEVGGGNGSGNRIAGDTKVKSIPKANQDDGLPSITEVKSATNVMESSAIGVKEGNSVTASATSVKEGNRRTVNYAGKKVFIDEIDRIEGPLENLGEGPLEELGHELRKKIENYKKK